MLVGCFPPLLFLGKCYITEDKMGKKNGEKREGKEVETKDNPESWLQHEDKASMWALLHEWRHREEAPDASWSSIVPALKLAGATSLEDALGILPWRCCGDGQASGHLGPLAREASAARGGRHTQGPGQRRRWGGCGHARTVHFARKMKSGRRL